MKFALFAANDVGYRIASHFGEHPNTLGCLVVDQGEDEAAKERIVDASGIDDPSRIFESPGTNSQEVREFLQELAIDVGVLAWWPYIIDENLLAIPSQGFLNLHPSYLPYNRGKDPNFWAIKEGTPFGVTIHWVTLEIDQGPIAFRRKIETTWEDTGGTLYEKATREIVELFEDNFDRIRQGNIPKKPQNEWKATYHEREDLHEASEILLDETYTARELMNLIRARTFEPHPAAWFDAEGSRFEVRIDITEADGGQNGNHETG